MCAKFIFLYFMVSFWTTRASATCCVCKYYMLKARIETVPHASRKHLSPCNGKRLPFFAVGCPTAACFTVLDPPVVRDVCCRKKRWEQKGTALWHPSNMDIMNHFAYSLTKWSWISQTLCWRRLYIWIKILCDLKWCKCNYMKWQVYAKGLKANPLESLVKRTRQ